MKRLIFTLILLAGYINIATAQVTIVVTYRGSGLSSQSWFTSGTNGPLREVEIKNHWNYDRYITSAAHTSNGWFIVMSKGVQWKNQSYKKTTQWPDAYVHEQKEEGYMITSLASSNSEWLVVTTQGTGYTDQQICAAPGSSLKEWISQWWNKDYYITSIACQNSLWTVVMSYGSGIKYTDQSYFTSSSTSDLEKKIKEKWDDGFRITALEYGDGVYMCIMSKYPGSSTDMQSYNINTNFEKSLEKKTNENYLITYIGG